MNTQLAFAFGMLAMVAIMMLVAIVVGIVKVVKLEKQFKELERSSSREIEFVHKRMADVEQSIYSELREIRNRFDQYMVDFRRDIESYTDSRVDKLEQKLSAKTKQILTN